MLNDPTTATGDMPFNGGSLKQLVNMIYGSEGDMGTQISSLKTSVGTTPLTAANLRAKTYNKTNGQSIVVRLGGLDWIVTYVSKDSDDNLVAALWLSNNHQEAWAGQNRNLGDHYGITNGGLYSDWSDDWNDRLTTIAYPTNMYGTSYIRVATLNNTGTGNKSKYATSSSTLSNAVTQSSSHIFSLYTVESKGLTRFLSTPSKMPWITAVQDRSLIGFNYNCSNDTLSKTGGTYYSSGYNYTGKDDYANWENDYLFLPSLVETGYNDTYAYDGLWETNTAERTTTGFVATSSNYIGSSQSNYSGTAYSNTWLRSALSSNHSTNASDCLTLSSSGSSNFYDSGDHSEAVRPVLLISLNSVASSSSPPITFDKQNGNGGTNTITVKIGNALPNITEPTRAGYVFDGYYTGANGGGTKIYNADGTPAITTSTFTAKATLYASWTPVTVTFSFDRQGATAGTTTKTATFNSALTSITPPTRTGYTFAGYFTEPNGAGSKIYNADGTPAISLSYFTIDTTLYACWQWKWYTIAGATGSTTSYTIYDDPEQSIKEAGFTIYPASGHRVSAFSFDNTNWYEVERYREEIFDTGVAMSVIYKSTTKSNVLAIEFDTILYNYSSPAPVPIYLQFVAGSSYSTLKKPASTVAVSGVVVTATLGGMAYIVGDDFENLEDTDTITVSTKLCQSGYTFVGWYLDDDRETKLSENTSYRVTKSVAYEHTLVAVYQPTSGSGVNLDVDNGG